VTDLDIRVTELLAELAEAVPVEARNAPAGPAVVGRDLDDRGEYPVRPLASLPPRRRLVLAAAAAVLAAALVAGLVVVRSEDRSPVSVSAADLAVDTAALGMGRMAVVVENDLYVADGPTGQVWKLTDVGSGEEISDVSFSHDGEWVAFMVSGDLWTVRWNGEDAEKLGASSGHAWSPTDDVLAFIAGRRPRWARAGEPAASNRSRAPGFDAAEGTTLAWSPDGAKVAYGADVMGTRFVTWFSVVDDADTPTAGGGPPFIEEVLAWPTDSALLTVERSASDESLFVSAVEVAPHGSAPVRVGAYFSVLGRLAPWDGQLSARANLSGAHLVTVDTTGSTAALVASGGAGLLLCSLTTFTCGGEVLVEPGRSVLAPTFSPDASMVSVVAEDGGSSDLLVAAADGTSIGRLSLGPRRVAPADGSSGPDQLAPIDPPQWGDGNWLLARVDHQRVVRWVPGEAEPDVVLEGSEGSADRSDGAAPVDRLAYWAPG
jgi:hypothetical protein